MIRDAPDGTTANTITELAVVREARAKKDGALADHGVARFSDVTGTDKWGERNRGRGGQADAAPPVESGMVTATEMQEFRRYLRAMERSAFGRDSREAEEFAAYLLRVETSCLGGRCRSGERAV